MLRDASFRWAAAILLTLGAGGCAAADDEAYSEGGGVEDLGIGDVESGANGLGYATQCKPIPDVEALVDPEIVVSLDGLTLHLRDRAGSYDRVFPIGPGKISKGASLTPTSEDAPKGVFYTGTNTAEVADGQFGYYYACRIWWQDPETKKKSPVFAGLPFIRLAGPPTSGYGIHGPIDNYGAENGGSLRHGYVSHGCMRMAAEDIVEVYARIKAHPKTPVRIQDEVELVNGVEPVDIEARWIGSECTEDADCNFDGGACRVPAGSSRGICTLACTKGCPDRAGEAGTFCVPDPETGEGICVPKASPIFNNQCARHEGRLVLKNGVKRPDSSAKADVCMPAE